MENIRECHIKAGMTKDEINFNHIVDEEIRVDISKLKNIEGIY